MSDRQQSVPQAGAHRVNLVEELYRRYGRGSGAWGPRARFWWKRSAWLVVVGGARALKRALDILSSLALLLVLWPLFLVVALCIKLTDGGPILFWQTRVGRYGREFPFP